MRRFLLILAIAATAHADVKMNGAAEDLQLVGMIQFHGETGDRGDTRFSTSNSRVFLRRYLRGPDAQHKVLARLQTVF